MPVRPKKKKKRNNPKVLIFFLCSKEPQLPLKAFGENISKKSGEVQNDSGRIWGQ
jgi:hypothetical protein